MFTEKRLSPISEIMTLLDGWAVAIQEPKSKDTMKPRTYRNKNGCFSFVVQAAVAVDYKLVFVAATYAGGTHDSTAFQASAMFSLGHEKRFRDGKL